MTYNMHLFRLEQLRVTRMDILLKMGAVEASTTASFLLFGCVQSRISLMHSLSFPRASIHLGRVLQ